MARKLYAFADRTGVIEFGPIVPEGRLPIARDWSRRIRDVVDIQARHGYEKGVLLVPGIPEADTDDAALDALVAFQERVEERLNRLFSEQSA